jgi:hypothetical protein
MTQFASERLYQLLPAIYRQRDAVAGEPLRALLAVMEQELQGLESDIEGLYENWFIETCDEWVVPYIADRLGMTGASAEVSAALSQRSLVANTIAYRRRKGNAIILENITFDVTGWRSRVVEFLDQVSVSQLVHHVRIDKGRTVSLRNHSILEDLNSPFDAIAHTVDIRRVGAEARQGQALVNGIRGRYNPSHLGLFLCRLQSYPIRLSSAYRVKEGCYTFHPTGRDLPLFNQPQAKLDPTQPAAAIQLPIALTASRFQADLKAYQSVAESQRPDHTDYYGLDRSFAIFRDGILIPPSDLISMGLDDWPLPPAGKVAVDVTLGRFVLPESDEEHPNVDVRYSYGFSADLGGGSYDRYATLAIAPAANTWVVQVGSSAPLKPLSDALEEWLHQRNRNGIIRIMDSGVYELPPTVRQIAVPANRQLVIESADGMRPTLVPAQALSVIGQGLDAKLVLNGLLMEATLHLQGSLQLNVLHSTLLGGLQSDGEAQLNANITISRSIVGPLYLPKQQTHLTIQDSIVDAHLGGAAPAKTTEASVPERVDLEERMAIAANPAGAAPGPTTTLNRTTIFGGVHLYELTAASNVLFTRPVHVQHCYSGSIRFSYVPNGSKTPPRYRCQPDFALRDMLAQSDQADAIRLQLHPHFTATHYPHSGYAQLSHQCALAIREGADDGAEMGAFHLLQQPQRLAYLQLNLEDYVPAHLEPNLFFMT